MNKIPKNVVYKTLVWQLGLILALSVILGWIFSMRTAISFALGGTLSVVPTFLFAKIFFKNKDDQTSKKVVHSFFYGKAIKWLVIIVLFILIFQWKGLQAIPFFLGIIIPQLVCWLAFVKLS